MRSGMTRRTALKTAALATTAIIAAPYVRGAHAAGRLTVGFWDHWVPGANKASQDLCAEWGEKNKVDVKVDYITSQGFKNLLTIAAEAQAKSGHDIFAFPSWQPAEYAHLLEPVDDVMADLIKVNGKVNATVDYLAKTTGKYAAVPTCVGSQIKGPNSRIDLMKKHAGIDLLEMYPAGGAPKADAWTFDSFLKAAEACQKAGNPFGIGLGVSEDNVDTAGAIFSSFGAHLVDAKGNVSVKSDKVRMALEYYLKLAQFLPPDAPSWDNASNNKYLVSGRGSLIMNPPSAWAVAKRDAPQVAEQLWTHGMPSGPSGPVCAVPTLLLGHLEFRQGEDCRKGLDPAPLDSIGRREDGERKPRLRPALVREADRLQGLGRRGAAEGYALPLPEPPQPPDSLDGRAACAAEDRRADLYAGSAYQDDRAHPQGREDGADAHLGRRRDRRVHARLMERDCARSPRRPGAVRKTRGGRRHKEQDESWEQTGAGVPRERDRCSA